MAVNPALRLGSIAVSSRKPQAPLYYENAKSTVALASNSALKASLRVSGLLADSTPKARLVARRSETVPVRQLGRPLSEYMSLPASQYSVLDAERIERVDESTFRCYVYRFKFFAFEVCPVLLVRVEEQPNGCIIRLLSCELEGSPIVVAQNEKFDASMVNQISYSSERHNSSVHLLTSDTVIEVTIDIPFAFRAIPAELIKSTGTQVLEQILRIMLPRFMAQTCLFSDWRAEVGHKYRTCNGTGARAGHNFQWYFNLVDDVNESDVITSKAAMSMLLNLGGGIQLTRSDDLDFQ